MYKYIIAFILLAPLIGVYSVEMGSYAGSVGMNGYKNGVTLQYFYYTIVIVAVALFVKLFNTKLSPALIPVQLDDVAFLSFSFKLLIFNFIFLVIMLFGFGGINVWLGKIDKGYFRANLGSFGAFAYLITKVSIPALFAYCSLLYSKTKKSTKVKYFFSFNVILILIIGSAWGFKSTGFVMMLPGVVLLFWDVKLLNVIKLFLAFIILFLIFSVWFDSHGELDINAIFLFFIERLTVLQGDISWYLWGQYQDGVHFQNYFPTLLAAIGDGNLKLLGYDQTNWFSWMQVHYDWMLSYSSGLPLETIASGHSIVGAPFSEGLIAGGLVGVYLFAIIAGLIIGITYNQLYRLININSNLWGSLLSTYFCLNIFPWLSGGGITQLFHISNVFAYAFTFVIILLINQVKIKI